MFNTFKFILPLLLLSACSVGAGAGPNAAAPSQNATLNSKNPFVKVDSEGNTQLVDNLLNQALTQMPKSDLSEAEKAGLLQMREEEKLAQEVYAVLAASWSSQSQTFQNISGSEATHTESVRQLLERYQVVDPALKEAGKFTAPALQSLYDTLVAQGKASYLAALQVGLEIEELDLADLKTQLGAVDQDDIRLVYQELERGSRNHLRAFSKALKAAGGTYTAKHLSQAEFDQIAQSAVERGSGG
ncbi:ferritin [bacterium (Candidatus Blackallbacteria) CG17_big_fil_post_rev_8_21_14_2_50_48_46]|uniref:Ferritin n=1 Tax=bacterium (Candidatus Blackallbacteria) CG17_big_fil_post_rev_8_21_14_2_50_48_46 TaxID=2014261 RepID=A0A2M7FZZ9_9BACT|nr:MAG: ferritin [bacterium (Candidatus Blackallbacteria) CG18_big_fil_WC_8_21_14_2_50_49_26]PIW14509.1 MAG: ferritin [bacterium (Candidatus Blackallbacteria) CG17_big_fil_post_rev_8_21_14_2_50_48_46]PIW47194.1 MAG: ferritin [bacterium (Candidatus Blackallbacteria) CG13_big_fil_rev_8_21_14_2_50_49_14]